jgi:hypothetical protein
MILDTIIVEQVSPQESIMIEYGVKVWGLSQNDRRVPLERTQMQRIEWR